MSHFQVTVSLVFSTWAMDTPFGSGAARQVAILAATLSAVFCGQDFSSCSRNSRGLCNSGGCLGHLPRQPISRSGVPILGTGISGMASKSVDLARQP